MEERIVNRIVRAIGVQKSDKVLIHYWGENDHKRMADMFMLGVAQQQAIPYFHQQSRELNGRMFNALEEDLSLSYYDQFKGYDVVVDLFAYQPVVGSSALSESGYNIYRKHMAHLFGILMQSKKFVQVRLPTVENAKDEKIDPEEYIQRISAAYDVDYDDIRRAGQQLVASLERHQTLKLTTNQQYVIEFDLTEREWHIDSGDGDLPCGEVYIAPVEEKTKGQIFFDCFYLEDILWKKVIIDVKDGQIVDCNYAEIAEWFKRLPEKERMIAELGFGLNPNVVDCCNVELLDEKMKGSFHIAVGRNTMFGGKNDAMMHRDFVGGKTSWKIEK